MADAAPAAIDTRIVTDEWTELDSVPLDDPELERDGEFAIAAPAPEGFLDFLESPRLLSALLALLALLRPAQQLAVALEQVGLGVERPAEEGREADDVAAEPQRRKRLDPLEEPPRRVEREARGAVQRKLLVDRVGRSVEPLVRSDDAADEEEEDIKEEK